MNDLERINALNGMMEANENLTLLYDWIERQRDELVKRGFSPTAAEAMAPGLWQSAVTGGQQ